VPYAVGALSLGMFGAALVFGVGAGRTETLAANETDPVKQAALFDSASTKRQVTVGLVASGVAVAGVAVWLFLRQKKDAGPSIEPVVGGQAGLQIRSTF
jgi:hypothetical protein